MSSDRHDRERLNTTLTVAPDTRDASKSGALRRRERDVWPLICTCRANNPSSNAHDELERSHMMSSLTPIGNVGPTDLQPPEISVVVPTCNRADLLPALLDALLAQRVH